MQTVSKMLAQNADNQDKYKSIPLETLPGGCGAMSRPRVKITLIDRKGPVGCHRGHQGG